MATTKVIKYRGKEYLAPVWTKFVATDHDGGVYAYAERPVCDVAYCDHWEPAESYAGGSTACEAIGHVTEDWRDSLEEL